MKKIFSKTAYTLIDLIISLMLVSVVILGVFSINTVLSNNNQDYGQKYSVKSQTQTTLNHILNNAALAVGNGTLDPNGHSEIGILVGAQVGDPNSFCIHQDIPSGPYSAPTTIDNATANNPSSSPPNYTNSRWLCYTWSSVTYQINYCAMPYNYNLANRGAANCSSGNVTSGPFYLGTAYKITPAFTDSEVSGQMSFSATILNCLNDSLATCSNTGTSADPANNPETNLSGSVIPSQESI
jgi:hypothetical protein